MFEIKRLERGRNASIGVLMHEGSIFCNTIERPENGNEPNISAIPCGLYKCKRYSSAKHSNTFILEDVYGRSYILFHIANTVDDLEGCIGVGERVGYLNGKRAVLDSTKAFNRFLEATKNLDSFMLRVSNG